MNKYNIAIIGAGNKGALSDAPGTGNEHKYLSYGHAAHDHPGFDIVAFVDNSEEREQAAVGLWGVKEGSITVPDVVVIATPDETHYPWLFAIAMNAYKPKLVICEKPLCMTVEQAGLITVKYEELGIPLMVDYTRRFIPYWQEQKKYIDTAGKFIKGYCYFNRGWEHTASHFIQLALWYNNTIDNIDIQEVPTDYQWVFQWGLFYEKGFASEHAVNFTQNPKVPSIYDKHLYHVLDNAYNFLEHGEPIMCTGMDGLRAIVETKKYKGRCVK